MKMIPAWFCVVLVAGCGEQPTPTVDSQSSADNLSQAAPAEVSPLVFQTPEELAAAYRTAFDAADTQTIEALVYWDGIPDDFRDATLVHMLRIKEVDGVNVKILSIEVQDPPPDLYQPHLYSTPPVKSLTGKYQGRRAGNTGELICPIGEVDGKFLFCAMKPDPR